MKTGPSPHPEQPSNQELPAYLSKAQLAQHLGVSHRTIDNMISRRTIPFVRLSGRLIRFPREAVENHLKNNLTVEACELGGK